MCLGNLKSERKVAAYKRKQPKEFVVWKLMDDSVKMETLFRDPQSREPLLAVPGKIYKAKSFPIRRARLTYKPGFHAFRTKKQAAKYRIKGFWRYRAKLVKFKARPEWITEIGKAEGILCLVLSHIKVPEGK